MPISIEDENKARICLPDDDNPVADDQECYATGWGHLEYGGFPSDYLPEVKVRRVSPDVCNDTNAYNGEIDETMTCAGFSEGLKDSCQNDSGGSLVCKVPGRFPLKKNSLFAKIWLYQRRFHVTSANKNFLHHFNRILPSKSFCR